MRENSIFLKLYCTEEYFSNKNSLNLVRQECDQICLQYRLDYPKLHKQHRDYIDQFLFRDLNIKKPKEFDYQTRREITSEEEELIKESCRKKKIHFDEIENIKFSLGYKTENSMYKKPCIAVIGQTKAGKSSLVNCILQQRVVPQKVSRQTARVVSVTHCKIRFVAHMGNSKLLKFEVEEDVKQEDVDLTFADRKKEGEVSVEIRVGTPNPIVQNGFDIVDSPGLNENPALNDLCAKMEKSMLPLLIYVVEGRNGLMQTDIDDIKKIKSKTPQLKIIYFITKLARSKYDRILYEEKRDKKRTKNELKDDEDMPGESDIEVANKRLDKVLRKMKLHAFVPPSTQILGSREFHGADIWAINDMRIHKPDKTHSECDKFNNKLMQWFEESIMLYLKERLEGPLKEEIQNILTPLEVVLEKATSVATEIEEERKEKKKSVKIFRDKENELYNTQLSYIQVSLKNAIHKMIVDSKPRLVQIIEDMESGNRGKGNARGPSDPLSSFIEEAKQRIEESLDEEIKEFVTRFMVEKERRLKQNLFNIVRFLTKGKCGSSSFEEMLKNRLFYEYEIFDESSEYQTSDLSGDSHKDSEISFNSSSVKRIVELVKSKGPLTQGLFKMSRSDEMKSGNEPSQSGGSSKDWKEKLVDQILNDFDKDKFSKTICDFVIDDFKERHGRFVQQLIEQEAFLNANILDSEQERSFLKSFTERLAVQYAIVLHVKTPLSVMIDPLKPSQRIGKSAQVSIKKVQLIGIKDPVLIKSYQQTFRDFRNSDRLQRIAMEIYYSSRLSSPRCLPLLGIHFENTSEGWKFVSYYPYLERGTIKNFLIEKRNDLSIGEELKGRMELCIEIAEGIQHLHKLGIIHNDLSLKNILIRNVDRNSLGFEKKICPVEAVISDYGLTKSFGFIENVEKIGTPLYIAPENFRQQFFDSYSSAVDVYSFSICVWQILSYNLTETYSNYYPRFALECEHSESQIEKFVIDGMRPEERDQIPKQARDLLKRCWHIDPKKRPSFTKPLSELSSNKDLNDPLRDKTIVDELRDIYENIQIDVPPR